MQKIAENVRLIDSHTGGEPTRVVIEGGPLLDQSDMSGKLNELRENHDWIRTTILSEPRGFDAMVGAILTPPVSEDAVAGVIFFNNAGYLGMCIHGTLGVAETLKYMGKITQGSHPIDTPAGKVTIHLHEDGEVSVDNVESYRLAADIDLHTESFGTFTGDIAWGGNWFFLINNQGPELDFSNVGILTSLCGEIKAAMKKQGVTAPDGKEVDHVELTADTENPAFDSKNFVYCPGDEYDRSPCGTGTSAKLACLFADGKLDIGQRWVQASILETTFTCEIKETNGTSIIPTISGKAYITAETTIITDPQDPFKHGIIKP